MKNLLKGFFGVILIICAIGTIFYWEMYGREHLLYENIVVLTKDVNRNDIITIEMITYQKREGSQIVKGAILDENKIIGKAAKSYIPKGVQLVEKYFENHKLVLDNNEYIFQIPTEWIRAFPSSIRRGDTIYFYEVGQGIENHNGAEVEIILNNTQALEKEPITSATVAYAKDSANREVVTLSDNERYDGSSKISEIEIIANLEIVNSLRESVDDNKLFIIMYQ
ncbi:MAG: SAF domain-containing protein [Vallitalea sp.]|jgi:hypothetical protein|nr:SAF domain-containing protein [Vallitalea sp.]